jgi:hypothetical protein
MELELREDEIEAILKFDGSQLHVAYTMNPHTKPAYIVIITGKGRVFSRTADVRISAVHQVWELYLKYTSEHPSKQNDGYWMYENAMGDVEVQLMRNKGKHNE